MAKSLQFVYSTKDILTDDSLSLGDVRCYYYYIYDPPIRIFVNP